jgi:hypothetical protein
MHWMHCTVDPFLHDKNMSAAEICHKFLVVYEQNVLSGGTVIQWCRMFKDGFDL